MTFLDWAIVVVYCIAVTLIGLSLKKKGEGGVDDYFLSGRKLPWWLAGTSLVATSIADLSGKRPLPSITNRTVVWSTGREAFPCGPVVLASRWCSLNGRLVSIIVFVQGF